MTHRGPFQPRPFCDLLPGDPAHPSAAPKSEKDENPRGSRPRRPWPGRQRGQLLLPEPWGWHAALWAHRLRPSPFSGRAAACPGLLRGAAIGELELRLRARCRGAFGGMLLRASTVWINPLLPAERCERGWLCPKTSRVSKGKAAHTGVRWCNF